MSSSYSGGSGLCALAGLRREATTKTARRYETLDQVNAEVTEARILAGLHFRQSMLAGSKLGADVAAEVAPRF